MRRTLLALCGLVLVLGGCTRGEPEEPLRTFEPQQTASSPSPKPQVAKDSEACKLLTPKDRRSIAGEKVEIVAPLPVTKGVLQCRWVKTLKTPVTPSIKVISRPVQIWASTVPRQIDRSIQTGTVDDKYLARLQAVKKKVIREADEISDSDACDIFALLVEVNEDRKNASEFVLYQGTTRGDFTVAWHRCSGGVETELTYEEPGLAPSEALSQSAVRLGKLAHKRAIKLL
jgi:hypothetical protein